MKRIGLALSGTMMLVVAAGLMFIYAIAYALTED